MPENVMPLALAPDTTLGPVRLTVADLARQIAFYERVLGLRTLLRDGDVARLGAPDGRVLVELVERADAPARPRRSCGLFHLAILLPTRGELARALRRLVAAGWPLGGASDHLVSEALYTADAEGNGIELYRDRPRAEWRREADGELAMATLPLDLEDLLGAAPADDEELGAPAGTTIGHVHLQVSELGAAQRFYVEALGFEVMVRSYPGALFVAAGGYHHHVGLNTWASAEAPAAQPGTRGLRDFAVLLPSAAERDRAAASLAAAGFPAREDDGATLVTDPFGLDVRLVAGADRRDGLSRP